MGSFDPCDSPTSVVVAHPNFAPATIYGARPGEIGVPRFKRSLQPIQVARPPQDGGKEKQRALCQRMGEATCT